MNNIQRSSARDWPIKLLKLLTVAVVFLCIGLTFVFAQNEKEVLMSILGVMCLIVLALPMFMYSDVSIFEPISFMVLLAIIGIPIKLVYVLWIRNNDIFVSEFVLLNQRPEIFLNGVIVVLVAFILFVFGYTMRFPRAPLAFVFVPQIEEWNGRRLQMVILILGAISILGFLAFVASAGVSFSSFASMSQKRFLDFRAEGGERMHSSLYLFCRLAAFSKFVVYFCFVWLIYRKKSFMSLIGCVMFLAIIQTILLAVILNSRAGVALILLDCTILSYFLMKTIDVKMVGACFAVASLLMIPMLAARVVNVGNHHGSGVSKIVQKTLCGRNMLDIAKACHIINGVPKKMGYRNGEMLYGWLAAPIPTKYWPEKPVWAGQGLILNQKIFEYRGSISGCPPGLMGELYWNFGRAGLWIGMLFAGVVFRQMYVSFLPFRDNPASILLYTMIFTRFFLFSIANDLGTGIVKAGLDLVPVYAILFFIGMLRATNNNQRENHSGNANSRASFSTKQQLEMV